VGGRLSVVQSRAITTLFPLPQPEPPAEAGLRVYLSVNVMQGVVEPLTPMGIALFRSIRRGFQPAPAVKVPAGPPFLDAHRPPAAPAFPQGPAHPVRHHGPPRHRDPRGAGGRRAAPPTRGPSPGLAVTPDVRPELAAPNPRRHVFAPDAARAPGGRGRPAG